MKPSKTANKLLIIENAFKKANKTGKFDKSLLPPNLCRTNTMTLWKDVLVKNTYNNIRILKLRYCAIQSEGVKILADGLGNAQIKSLETLDLMGNEIGVSGSRAIASLLAPRIDLDSFTVKETKSVIAQFEGRENIGCVKRLILSHNVISDGGCEYIGKALCICNTLHTLELENCQISNVGCKYLRRGIERNNTLLFLNIAANNFGDLGAHEIESFLIRNNSLEYLDISRNRLGPNRTFDIIKGLSRNNSLIKLRMNMNRMSARGAKMLTKMLFNSNNTLEELELSYNELFDAGVSLLSQGLITDNGLKKLILWYNGLTDESCRNIARALKQRVQMPHFKNEMIKAIANSQALYFMISDNNKLIPNPNTYHLCEVIVSYIPIYMYFEVDLSHNRKISKNGIQYLLNITNSDKICIEGLKDLLHCDRKERDATALKITSLY